MMANSADKPFDSPDWIFEIKLDGYRAITVLDAAPFSLNYRNDNDKTQANPLDESCSTYGDDEKIIT
jgi:ATP-dependent DNA ligase